MKQGKFIVFEGGEGSGKSRHSQAIAERLQAAGHEVVHTHEPGGSSICELIRAVILSEDGEGVSSRAELLLFLADRAQHVEKVIKPALDAGKVVICDRFSGSTFAYQIGGRQLSDGELITQMDAYAREGVEADLVMYLDIDPAEGLRRRGEDTNSVNRMDREELAFHQRVRDYFTQLADDNSNWIQHSTEGPKEENEEAIHSFIVDRLGL